MRHRHLLPADEFPVELALLGDPELLALYGRAIRQLERESIQFGATDPETEFRLEELRVELDRRDSRDALTASKRRIRGLNGKAGSEPPDSLYGGDA
jgi:hypothetical protein